MKKLFSSTFSRINEDLRFAQEICTQTQAKLLKRSWVWIFSSRGSLAKKAKNGHLHPFRPLIDQIRHGIPRGASADRRALEHSKKSLKRAEPNGRGYLAMIIRLVKSHCKGRRWAVSISLTPSLWFFKFHLKGCYLLQFYQPLTHTTCIWDPNAKTKSFSIIRILLLQEIEALILIFNFAVAMQFNLLIIVLAFAGSVVQTAYFLFLFPYPYPQIPLNQVAQPT